MTQERYDRLGAPIVESGTSWQGQIEKRLHAVEQGLREFREVEALRMTNRGLAEQNTVLRKQIDDLKGEVTRESMRASRAELRFEQWEDRIRSKLTSEFLDDL